MQRQQNTDEEKPEQNVKGIIIFFGFFSKTGIFIVHVSLQIMSQFLIRLYCFQSYFRHVLCSPICTCNLIVLPCLKFS